MTVRQCPQQQRMPLQLFYLNGLITGPSSILRAGLRIKENKEVVRGRGY